MHWTAQYYVGNFRNQLTDTFAFYLLNFTLTVNCFVFCECVEEVVCRKLRFLLRNRILNSSVRPPGRHILRKLQTNILVDGLSPRRVQAFLVGIVAAPPVLYLTFRF